MKRLAFTAMLAMAATAAQAKLLEVGKYPLVGGFAVFELYDDPAKVPVCTGVSSVRAVAKLEKSGKLYPYGEGCWVDRGDGSIHFIILNDEGLPYEKILRRSQMTWTKQAAAASTPSPTLQTAPPANEESSWDRDVRLLCVSTEQKGCWIKSGAALCDKDQRYCDALPDHAPAKILDKRGGRWHVQTDYGTGWVSGRMIMMDCRFMSPPNRCN